ncbi:alcohol dehydrogenase catalytic domain-containing protein [Candidatus Enterococcus ferrettii]|uniref:Ribitol-5-phosphate 2-dehydrogenase (NADP+) n=1 Tax=Candidatus Enterococcus ferrettii TaxID=2815324 RepID=A0ABV0EKG0_9ENTE|nr:alcohol dehydrogenase catalytic domain-containing protein [Enterococcus sp. 665A]MBO1339986.1 alcohol dehydrogenase catalytic domain-containing protein [Enterococcus sp. 665A]
MTVLLESRVLSLVKPKVIEEVTKEREVKEGWVAIEPTYASICHADLRYFAGLRRPEALAKKLPMALLHEGIGVVKESGSPDFKKGDRVVVVPNIPGTVLHSEMKQKADVPPNYSKGNAFLGSGYDGMAQSILVHPAECLVRIPDEIPAEIAVLSELSSVSHHAISHVKDKLVKEDTRVALFGDGPVGYFTAVMLRYLYGVKADRFMVFGAAEDKLANFDFARTANVLNYDFENEPEKFDVVIECTGGRFSESAINQAIMIADSLADIIFMGVTEELVPINTRDILEKGITVHGSSRSSTVDFAAVVEGMRNSDYREALRKILPKKIIEVSNGEDFRQLMEKFVENPGWNKTVMHFNWQA